MNLLNAVVGILILGILVTIGYKVGEIVIELNYPVTPQINTSSFTLPEETFANDTNLRWNHFPLTVYIDTSFLTEPQDYVNSVKQAMRNWEISTKNLVSFEEINDSDADITIEWVAELKKKSADILGNADLKFINISNIGLIQSVHIELLTKSDSIKLNGNDMTNLALHEIGHALGLHHVDNESSIMYPILVIPSGEVKQVSDYEKQILQDIYEVHPQPDLKIIKVNVSKTIIKRFTQTYYLLNMSLIIENDGLIDAVSPVMQIKTDDIIVKQETLSTLPIGNRLSIIYGNLHVENEFTTVEIVLDPDDLIDELDEENNFVSLSVT